MSFALMVVCFLIAGLLKLCDTAKWAYKDEQARKENRQLYLPKDSGMTIDRSRIGIRRDYVGEFEYANRLYLRLWREFTGSHPLGSFFRYATKRNGECVMHIQTAQDQIDAFQKKYTFGEFDSSGPGDYCLWQARKNAVERGFAPDNVRDRVWPGWDAANDPGHRELGRGCRWVEDKRYAASFYLSGGHAGYEADGVTRPHKTGDGRERLDIIVGFDPETELYKVQYTRLRTYLQNRQEFENASA